MSNEERQALEKEWAELRDKLQRADFPNPKDMRRKDEITSLLMTDGANGNIQFKFLKGTGGRKGMNVTKPYNRKGKVG